MFPVRIKQALSVTALVALAGCGSQGVTAMNPTQAASRGVVPMPAQTLNLSGDAITIPQKVGVRLTGEAPFNSPNYGRVLGYFNGRHSTISEVVKLTAATPVVFYNVDTVNPHTASFLGVATQHNAPWPPVFNGGSTKSPAGTVISTTNFSTGALNPASKSAKYNSGPPGFFMFGCAFHYDSDGMRTVIIVR